jgi:hypothetical protein
VCVDVAVWCDTKRATMKHEASPLASSGPWPGFLFEVLFFFRVGIKLRAWWTLVRSRLVVAKKLENRNRAFRFPCSSLFCVGVVGVW